MAKEKEIAVANTSSILFIAKLNRFDLVKNIFSSILMPKQVIKEILKKESPENEIIKKQIGNFIQEIEVKEIKDFNLDLGEQAAISLCLEKNVKIFISDDKKARKLSRSLNIETIGLAGIIIYNLEEKNISKTESKELINQLIKEGYYMSSSFYTEIINLIDKTQ